MKYQITSLKHAIRKFNPNRREDEHILKDPTIRTDDQITTKIVDPGEWEIDTTPTVVDDKIYITHEASKAIMQFSFIKSSTSCLFQLEDILNYHWNMGPIYATSDQFLIAMIIFSGKKYDDAIVHYVQDGYCHVRIASNDYDRIWLFERNSWKPGGFKNNRGDWLIDVTDVYSLSIGEEEISPVDGRGGYNRGSISSAK